MTRRDRAACTLALEWCRYERPVRNIDGAIDALYVGDSLGPRLGSMVDSDDRYAAPRRLLRARLALYLRALLRADAGDCGLTFIRLSNGVERPVIDGRSDLGSNVPNGPWTPIYRITPLWQLAPATVTA